MAILESSHGAVKRDHGGEGGIRTHEPGFARLPAFEAGSFNHSDTSPRRTKYIQRNKGAGGRQPAKRGRLPGEHASFLPAHLAILAEPNAQPNPADSLFPFAVTHTHAIDYGIARVSPASEWPCGIPALPEDADNLEAIFCSPGAQARKAPADE